MNKNIIKEICIKLNLTHKELSNMLDISLPTINRWSSDNSKIPQLWILTLKLILENIKLKDKLETIKKAQNILNDLD